MSEPTYESIKHDLENAIVRGMASTLWLMAFADWAENTSWDGRARGGENWEDVAPETPGAADKAALALVSAIAAREGISGTTPMVELLSLAMYVDTGFEFQLDQPDADEVAYDFGGAMAMEALGTGVAWSDDHRVKYGDLTFDPDMPHMSTEFDGSRLSWHGPAIPWADQHAWSQPRISISFETVSYGEEGEDPDVQTGWIDEEGVDIVPSDEGDSFDERIVNGAVEFLRDEMNGIEPSSSSWHQGVWYTDSASDENFVTGENTSRSYHLDGFTENQQRAIFDELTKRRRRR